MKSRYERLLSDATTHAPNPAQEASEDPSTIMGLNDKGELLRGVLLPDSSYHFFIVKTYKIHVAQTTERTDIAGLSKAGMYHSDLDETTSNGRNDPAEAKEGYSVLHFILCLCLVFLLARFLKANGFH